MRFDIITIFPNILDSYTKESFIGSAQKKKLINLNFHNLRNWTTDKHQTVDDRPFGGGKGMVMKIEPIYSAIKDIKKKSKEKTKVILFTPRGKKFNQKMASEFAELEQLIMICGRYEGIDERVAKIADMTVSIGNYDLMGGELPAMIVTEAVSRLIPGVLGKEDFLKERKKGSGFIEYAQYTRPDTFITKEGKSLNVPKDLLSGDHKKIQDWRNKHRKIIDK
jgi:tRNA (guanine37-N1)-methyltransferase